MVSGHPHNLHSGKYCLDIWFHQKIYLENLFEVVAARRKDNFMCSYAFVVTNQGYIHKLIVLPQFSNAVDNICLVVGPLDAELSACHPALNAFQFSGFSSFCGSV